MIKVINTTIIMLLFCSSMFFQSLGINNDDSSPASSAMLDVSSTIKGFLSPRITYEHRNSIPDSVAGLTIWCNNGPTFGELQVYNGTTRTNFIGGTASGEGVEPDAPTFGTASARVGQALITFTAPYSNGWSPICSYTATSSPDEKNVQSRPGLNISLIIIFYKYLTSERSNQIFSEFFNKTKIIFNCPLFAPSLFLLKKTLWFDFYNFFVILFLQENQINLTCFRKNQI
jgi:hypothetical protein